MGTVKTGRSAVLAPIPSSGPMAEGRMTHPAGPLGIGTLRGSAAL
jgi:hypothetical protein